MRKYKVFSSELEQDILKEQKSEIESRDMVL